MKLTLLHKGLFLVSIPLVFEVTIFGYLFNLQVQMEREAQKINRFKQINDDVNMIVRDVIAMTDAVNDSPMMKEQNEWSSFAYCLALIKGKMKDITIRGHHLKQLAIENKDPRILSKVNDCSRAMALIRRDLSELLGKIQSGADEDMRVVLRTSRKKLDTDIHLSLRSGLLELGEESLKGTSDETSSQIRERMRVLLKFAIGLSVLVALMLAVTFSRQLASRLARLNANADRLAHGQELLADLGGTDEVAELDRSFHYAAELIEAAKRMREEVMAMITHDLKTPLQSILSYLEMLESGMFGAVNQQGTELLSMAQGASDHMVSLIDSVLQLEKLRTGNLRLNLEPVEISSLLGKCLELVEVFAQAKHVTLVPSYNHQQNELVMGDAFWLKEIFVNILSNAIKFTREQTNVTIRTRTVGEQMEIGIEDQGPGISEAERKLIFERFHRVQRTANVPGSGLGLTIAKELVDLHHGSIEVESIVGRGSTFVILLPIRKS